MKTGKCATVACPNPATTCISYSYPESRNELEHEHVCGECAESYVQRPTLRASVLGSR
jgi:hypothetical protein